MFTFDTVFNTVNFEKDLTTEEAYVKFKSDLEFDLVDIQSSSQRAYVTDVKSEIRYLKDKEAIEDLKDLKMSKEYLLTTKEAGSPRYIEIEQDIASIHQKIIDREAKFEKASPLYATYQQDYQVYADQQIAEALQASLDALIAFGESKGW